MKIRNGEALEILTDNGKVTGVHLVDGSVIDADSVLIATGGLSYPVTGSTGDGFRMAAALGHTVTELKPSLVPLECHEGFCSKLSGLSLKNVTFTVFEEGKKKPVFSELGEMLFTHFGVSGPLVLSASAHLRNMGKKQYDAFIDLKPALTPEQLDNRVLRDFGENLNRDFINSLDKTRKKAWLFNEIANHIDKFTPEIRSVIVSLSEKVQAECYKGFVKAAKKADKITKILSETFDKLNITKYNIIEKFKSRTIL